MAMSKSRVRERNNAALAVALVVAVVGVSFAAGSVQPLVLLGIFARLLTASSTPDPAGKA
jgi:hypothetical protein